MKPSESEKDVCIDELASRLRVLMEIFESPRFTDRYQDGPAIRRVLTKWGLLE